MFTRLILALLVQCSLAFVSKENVNGSPPTRNSLKILDKTCQNLYGFLSYPRQYKGITVISLQPLRVRVEVEMTAPDTGTKESFTAEGMICQNGFNSTVGQAVCHAIGGKKYIGAFTDQSWSAQPNVKEDLCYFHYNQESQLVPCSFILDNLECAVGELNLLNCATKSPLFVHQGCNKDTHVSVVCSNSVQVTTVTSTQAPLTSVTTSVTDPAPKCASVLLLGDSFSEVNIAGNEELANYLRADGMTVTVVHDGIEKFTGTPDPKQFDVILLIPLKWYVDDMPSAGQIALLEAHRSGVNIVMTEWAAWHTMYNRRQLLKPLLLLRHDGGQAYVPYLTFTNLIDGHPIWQGLPKTFTSAIPIACITPLVVINNGTLIASLAQASGTGVAVREAVPGGEGRIVQINHAAQAHGSPWGVDPNIRKMMINSIKWAAKCI